MGVVAPNGMFAFGWSGSGAGSNGGGGAQRRPKTYVVGTTPGAPLEGTSVWQLPDFENAYVVLIIGRSVFVDLADAGDGNAFITKDLSDDTLTITNYTWQAGDILTYILVVP